MAISKSFALYLRIVQFKRSLTVKYLYHNLQLALLAVDFFNHSGEILERAVGNLNAFADNVIVYTVRKTDTLVVFDNSCITSPVRRASMNT